MKSFKQFVLSEAYNEGEIMEAIFAIAVANFLADDNISIDKAMKIVKERDLKNQELYRQLYDIDFGQDLSVFDLTIDTNDIDINEVSKILIKSINESI